MPTKTSAVVLAVATLGLAATAASAKQYGPLKQPKHEPCRAHYVKRVEKVKVHGHEIGKTFCVYHAPSALTPATTPSTPVPTTALETTTGVSSASGGGILFSEPSYIAVSTDVFSGSSEVRSLPVTVTIQNRTTEQTVGSFVEPSNLYSTCTVVDRLEGGDWIFTGQAVAPHEGCALGTVAMPEGDVPSLKASFGGNGQYAASTSEYGSFF
jgi:hypothetical protein